VANRIHIKRLLEGSDVWNQWRSSRPGLRPDLSGAKLSSADLRQCDLGSAFLFDADLRRANLRGVVLCKASLIRADFREASLGQADVTEADARHANLSYAILSGADLSRANLTHVNFSWSLLSDARFDKAQMGWTTFAGIDLSSAVGLETVCHDGPSSIGIETILRAQGRIPDAFLRGCGVPEQFINYARSLVANRMDFHSCFISYSTKDQEFADQFHTDLQKQGVRCWFAPQDIKAGKKIHEQVDEAVRLHDRLLLILSEHSMNSEWVKTEIAHARQKELNESRQVLFPISLVPFARIRDWKCFDADTGKDSARDPGVLHPRLQQLEGSRFVSEGVSAACSGPQSRRAET
jgi:uncharacterized protein YjbI with pentapeptide repeats